MLESLIKTFKVPAIAVGPDLKMISSNDQANEWIKTHPGCKGFSEFINIKFGDVYGHAWSNLLDPRSQAIVTHDLDGDITEVSATLLDHGNYLVLFKRLRKDVNKIENSYKSLIEKSPIATAIYRPDGTPKYYNEAYGNIWGAPKEIGKALVSNSDYNIFKDEQLIEVGLMPFVQKGFGGDTVDIPPVRYNPIKTASLAHFGIDQEKYVKGHIYPVKDESDSIKEVAIVLSDITFQMQAEEILTQNHLKFQLLTMGIPGVIYEYNFDGEPHFNFLSQGSIEMFGFTPEEIINDHNVITSMIHEDDIENFLETSKEAAEHGEKWEWQGRFIVSGQVKWIEGKSDIQGSDPNRRYGLLLDVTERVLAEKASKRNELLFDQLFDNSPLGLVLLDEKHNVVQVNHGFERIFEYTQEELVGKKLNDLIVSDGEAKEALDINMLTARGEVGHLESVRINKHGERIPVIIYGVPVSFEDQTIGIYGIYVDITERIRIENELKIRNDELDNFVYKVSHDLRAPLSSVLGLVNLAKLEKSADNLKEYVDMIENRIKLLDGFINDVLSHSKNLKLEVEISEVNLEQIIEKCFTDLSYLPFAGKVDVRLNIENTGFFSDRWRVNEIFRNLISNAIKYVDPSKEHSFVSVYVKVTEKYAEILIEDNGIGISEDTLPRIFEMFYRATEFAEGSGIGLYIVKNAVQKLGGTIKIDSEDRIGTGFKIRLPNQKPRQ